MFSIMEMYNRQKNIWKTIIVRKFLFTSCGYKIILFNYTYMPYISAARSVISNDDDDDRLNFT